MYDFYRCKLCTHIAAPLYRLPETTVHACTACGFHYIDHLDALPDGTVDSPALLDDASRRFIEGRIPSNATQHEGHVRLVARHRSLSGAHCLDVGAGAGVFLSLAKREGASVVGIEPQAIFREFCRQKFGIDLYSEPLGCEKWLNLAGSFDIVTMWDVLEHVNFPGELLRQALSMLKPGGMLFLDTPCRDSIAYRTAELLYRVSRGTNTHLLQSMYSPRPYRHKQIFHRPLLLGYLQQIGFSIVFTTSSLCTVRSKIIVGCRKPTGD